MWVCIRSDQFIDGSASARLTRERSLGLGQKQPRSGEACRKAWEAAFVPPPLIGPRRDDGVTPSPRPSECTPSQCAGVELGWRDYGDTTGNTDLGGGPE